MVRLIFIVFLSASILSLCSCDMQSIKRDLPQVKIGSAPPEFYSYTLEGEEVKLHNYYGKIVMLVFWKTWCEACKQELQEMTYVQEKYRKYLTILAINMGESKDAVRFFKRRLRLNFPVLMDQDLIISTSYGIVVWPTTILINKEGLVHWTGVGLETGKIKKEIEILSKS
ncbi:MAG: redoxin domain-containing protein [Nitrospirae bacterium]|nr:redoxin domain-containing protein [Nitrospirota bacterium]